MRGLLAGLIAVIGFLALAESLTCNKCSVGLIGFCLNPSTVTCSTNTSSCFTGKATFPNITGFLGFNSQGCQEAALCNVSTTGTIMGAGYVISQTCCSTDKCNPVQLSSSAPYMQLSLTAALSATLLAFV